MRNAEILHKKSFVSWLANKRKTIPIFVFERDLKVMPHSIGDMRNSSLVVCLKSFDPVVENWKMHSTADLKETVVNEEQKGEQFASWFTAAWRWIYRSENKENLFLDKTCYTLWNIALQRRKSHNKLSGALHCSTSRPFFVFNSPSFYVARRRTQLSSWNG